MLHFSTDEFSSRLNSLLAVMAERRLDAMLLFAQESMYWLTGYDTEPLSVCTVSNINNPGDSVPSQGKLTTVYVDVSCPNHQDD